MCNTYLKKVPSPCAEVKAVKNCRKKFDDGEAEKDKKNDDEPKDDNKFSNDDEGICDDKDKKSLGPFATAFE